MIRLLLLKTIILLIGLLVLLLFNTYFMKLFDHSNFESEEDVKKSRRVELGLNKKVTFVILNSY